MNRVYSHIESSLHNILTTNKMDPYTIVFYMIEAYIFMKHVIMNLLKTLYQIPYIGKSCYYIKQTMKSLHDKYYRIKCEPDSLPWISMSYISSITKPEFNQEGLPTGNMIDGDFKFHENYTENPTSIYGNPLEIREGWEFKPIDEQTNLERYMMSTVFQQIGEWFIGNDIKLPLLYMRKDKVDDLTDSYVITHMDSSLSFGYKLDKLVETHTRSKVRFLFVEYVHPRMTHHIPLEIPENMLYVGNELLSSTFVLRFLEYTLGNGNFVFDKNYRLIAMTKDVEYIELNFDQYLLLDTETSYKIKKW